MSHAGHDHPATPAGRAACRKAGGASTPVVTKKSPVKESLGKRMVKHAAEPEKPVKKVKGDTEQLWRVPLTVIPDGSSLLGMPAYVAELVKLAWRKEWRVDVGPVWNTDGRRSVRVSTYRGEMTVRWMREGSGITSVVWASDEDGAEELGSMNEGIRKLKGE
jgi:hypothetical protein